jgi:hypothetical protein
MHPAGLAKPFAAINSRGAEILAMLTNLAKCCASIGVVCRTRAAALIITAAFAMTVIALCAPRTDFSELAGGDDLHKAMLQSAIRSF